MEHAQNPTAKKKDITAKKKLLSDFWFIITPELEQLLWDAENDVQRENLVLGIIHHRFEIADLHASKQRIAEKRALRFGK